MPLSFFCLASGPRYLSAPEVAMFYLLETMLAPVWVWMIFAEVPSRQSMVGGTILIVSLIAHSLWQLRQGRRRRAAAIVRHPA
jgi:drug/metabolite transporter (DMT)-like permease